MPCGSKTGRARSNCSSSTTNRKVSTSPDYSIGAPWKHLGSIPISNHRGAPPAPWRDAWRWAWAPPHRPLLRRRRQSPRVVGQPLSSVAWAWRGNCSATPPAMLLITSPPTLCFWLAHMGCSDKTRARARQSRMARWPRNAARKSLPSTNRRQRKRQPRSASSKRKQLWGNLFGPDGTPKEHPLLKDMDPQAAAALYAMGPDQALPLLGTYVMGNAKLKADLNTKLSASVAAENAIRAKHGLPLIPTPAPIGATPATPAGTPATTGAAPPPFGPPPAPPTMTQLPPVGTAAPPAAAPTVPAAPSAAATAASRFANKGPYAPIPSVPTTAAEAERQRPAGVPAQPLVMGLPIDVQREIARAKKETTGVEDKVLEDAIKAKEKEMQPTEATKTDAAKADTYFRSMYNALEDYKARVKETGFVFIPGTKAYDDVTGMRADILLQAKELWNLGVLTGNDYKILQTQLPDPEVRFSKGDKDFPRNITPLLGAMDKDV